MDRLGSIEQAAKICKESTCLVDLGRKVNTDYVAQARIGRFGGNLTIKVELYRVGNGGLIASFIDNSKNVQGSLFILENKAPAMFKKMPENSSVAKVSTNTAKNAKAVTKESANSFTDTRDGKIYKAVKIGKQTWMAENLNYNAKSSSCYGNEAANCQKYGRLYTWFMAMNIDAEYCRFGSAYGRTDCEAPEQPHHNYRGICPSGWHIPSRKEWNELNKDQSAWYKNNHNGEDKFDFAALLSGLGLFDNEGAQFMDIGGSGNWWGVDLTLTGMAYCFSIGNKSRACDQNGRHYSWMHSVRCIQD